MSAYLIDYPFAGRLFPCALKVLKRLRGFGPTVILSDGDVVFQPHKVERAGLSDAVDGRVLIYIHKEEALDDVERRFPAEHYVLVDDKPRILAAVKRFWGGRVTTVFARQGSYARDPQSVGALPPADVMIERIGDLLSFDLPRLRPTRDRLLRPDRAAGGLGNRRRPHDDGEARGGHVGRPEAGDRQRAGGRYLDHLGARRVRGYALPLATICRDLPGFSGARWRMRSN